MTVPVSSPTVASTSFRGLPYLGVISRGSPALAPFAVRFACFDVGIRSLTFVIGFSSMFSRFSFCRTKALSRKAVGKTPTRARIQTNCAIGFTEPYYMNIGVFLRTGSPDPKALSPEDASPKDKYQPRRVASGVGVEEFATRMAELSTQGGPFAVAGGAEAGGATLPEPRVTIL